MKLIDTMAWADAFLWQKCLGWERQTAWCWEMLGRGLLGISVGLFFFPTQLVYLPSGYLT